MSAKIEQDGDYADTEELFHDLFTSSATEDDLVLKYDNIIVHAFDGQNTRVVYTFILTNGLEFQSTLYVPMEMVQASVMPTLFAIGMCKSLWFWMGFATPTIHIGSKVCEMVYIDQSMLSYWDFVIHGVLLEYMYMNNLKFRVKITAAIMCFSRAGYEHEVCALGSAGSKQDVLVPIGGEKRCAYFDSIKNKTFLDYCTMNFICTVGGKDSLFVWGKIKEAGHVPLLLHVTDGLLEYESNWRTQKLLDLTGDGYLICELWWWLFLLLPSK